MNDDKRLAEEYIQPGASIYYALRFSRKYNSDALIPIIVFAKEIRKLTMHYREIEIAKIKLKWWHDEILKTYDNNPTHPISHALLTIIKQYHIPQQLFTEYLDGASLKIDTDHFCTDKDIELYSYREHGLVMIMMSYILYEPLSKVLPSLHCLAYSITLIDIISHIRDYANKNKQIFSLAAQDSLKEELALFKHYSSLAKEEYQKGLAKLSLKQKKQLKPILIYHKLKITLLDEIEKDGFKVMNYEYHLTPLRKCWLAWREAVF